MFEVTAKCEAMVQADRCAAAGCPRLLRPYPPRLTAAAAAPANAWSPDARARVRLGAVRLGHCSSLSAAVAGRPRPTVRCRSLPRCWLCVGNPRGSSIARERRTTDAPRRAGALPDDDGAVNFEDPLEGMMVTLYKVSGAFVLWRHPCAISERKFHDSVRHLSVHSGQEEDGVRGEGVQV